jgi:hypothetical protein
MSPRITSDDLHDWADHFGSEEGFAALLADLVMASARDLRRCRFLTGRGIYTSGWDGETDAGSASLNVPDGRAGWEVSVRHDCLSKANEDFAHRYEDYEGDPAYRGATTYIAATARHWTGMLEWVEAKRREAKWRDVVGLDAHDIAGWLNDAPAVCASFVRTLSLPGASADTVPGWWDDFSVTTRPSLTHGIALAGRDLEVSHLLAVLSRGVPAIVPVVAETRDLAVAFIVAAILSSTDPDARDELVARSLVVGDVTEWRELTRSHHPLVLIPNFDENPEAFAQARNRGHIVIVPLPEEHGEQADSITVPPLGRRPLTEALSAAGVTQDELSRVLRTFDGSLRVLHQRMNEYRAGGGTHIGPELAGILLLGSWDEGISTDREIVAAVVGTDYPTVQRIARLGRFVDNSPLTKVGSVWRVSTIGLAQELAAPFVDDELLGRFVVACVDVLAAPDTRFTLPADARWAGALSGKGTANSNHLRDALAEALCALVSSLPSAGRLSVERVSGYVCRAIEQIFGTDDWEVWASLDRLLPLLAEACPDVFLSAVTRGLAGGIFGPLFTDSAPGFFGGTPWVGLIWSLQRLGWIRGHAQEAALSLGRLDKLDPGGNTSPRPISSLVDMLLPERRESCLSAQEVTEVVDRLGAEEPELAWKLLRRLVTAGVGPLVPASRPQFSPTPDPANDGARELVARDLPARLLAQASARPERWADLVRDLEHFHPLAFEAILTGLEQLNTEVWTDEDRLVAWTPLRDLIAQHRRFPEARWRLSDAVLGRLSAQEKRLGPQSLLLQSVWLFSATAAPDVPVSATAEGDEADLKRRRMDAVRVILAAGGIDAIVTLARRVENRWILGWALAEGTSDTDPIDFADHLSQRGGKALSPLVEGFIFRAFELRGEDWILGALADPRLGAWPKEYSTLPLLALPFQASTWQTVYGAGEPRYTEYWTRVIPVGKLDSEQVGQVTESFLSTGNYFRALDFLALRRDRASAEMILSTFETALAPGNVGRVDWPRLGWEVGLLLETLAQGNDLVRVGRLEWQLLPLLAALDRKPVALLNAMSHDPAVFLEVLRAAGHKTESGETEDQTREVRLRGWRALERWRVPPGTRADGSLDSDDLHTWVRAARGLAQGAGLLPRADYYIGCTLANCRVGSDGMWPDEPVRDLIEQVDSRELADGFSQTAASPRGLISRSIEAGGEAERGRAAGYLDAAGRIEERWPRTAAALRQIAHYLQAEATMWEQRAWLNEP